MGDEIMTFHYYYKRIPPKYWPEAVREISHYFLCNQNGDKYFTVSQYLPTSLKDGILMCGHTTMFCRPNEMGLYHKIVKTVAPPGGLGAVSLSATPPNGPLSRATSPFSV